MTIHQGKDIDDLTWAGVSLAMTIHQDKDIDDLTWAGVSYAFCCHMIYLMFKKKLHSSPFPQIVA